MKIRVCSFLCRIFDHTCSLHQWNDVNWSQQINVVKLYNVYLLTSVDVVPLMKTAGVVENFGHCTYSIELKCFWNCLSLFHLVYLFYFIILLFYFILFYYLLYIYIYIYMKCIVTNKYASRVLEYNYTNSQKICTWHFNSNDFITKCDVSVLLGPSTGEHIKVCRNKSTS